MKGLLIFISITAILFCLSTAANAQQIIDNGAATTAVNFPNNGCVYSWVNNNPGIGLAASGVGNIASFTAINTGNVPVTATIVATPQQANYAYVSSIGSNNISVINTTTNTLVTTIPMQQQPAAVSASPDGSRVYVICEGSTSVQVINTTSNTVVANIAVGANSQADPENLRVSPDGKSVYVVNLHDETISVISTASNTVTAIISGGFIQPFCLAFIPNSNLLYLSSQPNTIIVINNSTNSFVTTIAVGADPIAIATSPDGSQAFVTNQTDNTVSVINTATSAIVTTIPVGNAPYGAVVSNDGNFLYVGCRNDGTVNVIDTKTDKVVKIINGTGDSAGISVTPDGKEVYVTNDTDPGSVTVISTATNSVIATVPVGMYPYSMGNFIIAGPPCNGTPITFTITVNPTSATGQSIVAGPVSGAISTCQGTASASPNIQQFTVSGSNLTGNITATAPPGGAFELSLTAAGGYGSSVTLTPSGGKVANTVIYVRSAATAPAGNLSGSVTLASAGAVPQNLTVTATVNALPVVNPVSGQTFTAGQATTVVSFTGTGNSYTWVNNTPGIGLAASGTGNIPSFTAINTGATPLTATITVTPNGASPGNCPGAPTTFTITVNPTQSIVAGPVSGTISACQGTASASPDIQQFTVSGTNLTGSITATAPPDGAFELSLNTTGGYGSSVTLTPSGGKVANTVVYVRSSATAPAGNLFGSVTLTSAGASSQNLTVKAIVNALPVVNPVSNQTLTAGQATLVVSFTGTGNSYTWVNDTPGIGLAASGTGNIPSFTTANTGTTPLKATITVTPNAASLGNCPGLPQTFTITVNPPPPIVKLSPVVIPNTFTPNGDGVNDTWDIKNVSSYPNCTVQVYTRYGENIYSSVGYPTAWDGTYKGAALPVGTYYFIIDLKNGQSPLSGFVAIIR